MAPFFTGITRALGGAGFSRKKIKIEVPVRFYVDLYGAQGGDYGINNNGNPPSSDPQRFGGNGGYTRVDMTVPTAYSLEINSPVSGYAGGGGNGVPGGGSVGFSIDQQWMAITGGGGGAAGTYNFDTNFNPAFLFIGTGPSGGAGGGAISAGPPPGSSGSVGANANSIYSNPQPTSQSGQQAGGGGGGAPGGTGGTGQQAGGGGGANIRIKFETSSLSGPLAPIGFPDITMSYVTGTNGGNPRGSSARVIITNFSTNNTYTVTNPSVPVEFIKSL